MVERRLAELHIVAARERALRVFAFVSTVYPKEWDKLFTEPAIVDIQEFAFHARRVHQICDLGDLKTPSIKKFLVEFSNYSGPPWEENYAFALNRLVHIKGFVFGGAQADHRKIFLKTEANITPLYLEIETDNFGPASISIYGLIDTFLGVVLPEIRSRFPEFQF